MQLGFISNKTPADLDLAQTIGYTNVELFFSMRGEGSVQFPEKDEFLRALADSDITVSAIALHNDDWPICCEPKMQALSEDRFKDALEVACEVDATVLYTGSGTDLTGTGLHPENDQEEVARRIVDVFAPRLEQATAAGRTLAFISCKTANLVRSPAMWSRVLPHLKGMGIKYDPSHGAQDGRPYLAEAEDWAGHFVHAHAKDIMQIGERFHADPNPGFGQIQWGPLFALLHEADYDGAIAVEPHSDFWANRRREAGLRASYRYLSQFLLD